MIQTYHTGYNNILYNIIIKLFIVMLTCELML